MRHVGLTGGIGSGKSTVAALLGDRGAVVIDADRLARDALSPGSRGLDEVVQAFGAAVVSSDGSLDRVRLAERVFGDDDARVRLESIVHPEVARRTAELVAAAPPGAVVVHDVPLLVEKSLAARYDLVVVVETPAEVRLARLAARGMPADAARARMAVQATDAERRAVADLVIVNAGTATDLEREVDRIWPLLAGESVGGST